MQTLMTLRAAGFTLMETVVVIVVLGIIGVSLGIFILASIITSRTTTPKQAAPTPRNVG